jgi:hypothetical protein
VEPSEKQPGVSNKITAQATATEENLHEGRTKHPHSNNSTILTQCRTTNVKRDWQISANKRVVNRYHMGKYADVVDTNMIKPLSDTAKKTK